MRHSTRFTDDEIARATECANTILAQLGGNRFLILTGARACMIAPKGDLFLTFPSVAKGHANRANISLDAGTDTYTIEAYRVWGAMTKNSYKTDGIYADQLKGVISRITGLELSL